MNKDFEVRNEGSIFLLRPITEAAQIWCDEHLPEDAQLWGASYVIEHRYIRPIVEALVAEGYKFDERRPS